MEIAVFPMSHKSGKCYFYHGTMRSGKSAHIIMQVYNLKEKGYDVAIIKPSADTRDGNFVKSRALNTKYKAEVFSNLDELKEILLNPNIDMLFIDESQFISEQCILYIINHSHINGIKSFFYGLKNSYTGELFEGAKTLFQYADSIRELKSICDNCDKKATMHLKRVNGELVFEGDQIAVGDEEYLTVCASCFLDSKNKNKR